MFLPTIENGDLQLSTAPDPERDPSGFLEGFNDYFWRLSRRIKRRYSLPCESYDDIPVLWDETPYNKLKFTFSEMQRRNKQVFSFW